MQTKRVTVDQIFYEDFPEYSQISMATVRFNKEGIDVFIQRKDMSDIQVSLTHDDISLLRKIFSDIEFTEL